jgi:superfamily I DNA/RNA helicase
MADDPLLAMTVLDFISWYQRRDIECLMPEDKDRSVILMTAHAAKGLEFPSVLLHGVGHRLGGDPADREETNLLYVAATRAETCLCLNRGAWNESD